MLTINNNVKDKGFTPQSSLGNLLKKGKKKSFDQCEKFRSVVTIRVNSM
jgi:hypothetical protein